MGRPSRIRGRGAALVAVIVLLGVVLAASGCVPGIRSALGLPGGYAITLLRSGTLYTEARPGAWLWGSPPYQSTLVLAAAGGSITIQSDVSVEDGRVIISVRDGLWGGEELYSEHVTASRATSVQVPTPAGGIYRVTADYVFSYRGVARIDWWVQ